MRALAWRLAIALGLIALVVFIVYIGRDGYRDAQEDRLSLLDATYYAVVSLSTTGYGDITPLTPTARFVNVVVITPARVLFLIILVGTTLEVLTDQFRTKIRLDAWRRTVQDHFVVCGYGTKGRSAVKALLDDGVNPRRIVVVEPSAQVAAQAANAGFAVVEGDATRRSVLEQAGARKARAVIVATRTDDAAVLITLTVRQLAGPDTRIVAAVREAENAALLRQSGAHQVVVSAATAGQLLGLATHAPPVVNVIEDLLTPGEGMAIATRSVTRDELGRAPRELADLIIALVRRGQTVHITDPAAATLQPGDLIIYIRDDRTTSEKPV